MEKKLITFAINTKNNLNYLKLCVESIQKNAYHQNCDIAIVADGCTDGTNEWLIKLAEIEPRLKYWIHEDKWDLKYWGIGGSLNFLAEKCETEYFLPLHSDMYVGYHFDKELLELCSKTEKSVISAHRVEPDMFGAIKDNNKIFITLRPGTLVYVKSAFGYTYSNFDKEKFLKFSEMFQKANSFAIRKGEGAGGFIIRTNDWINNDQLFAPSSYEDVDLFIRMQLKNYNFILTSKSLIWHFAARSSHFPNDDFSKTSQRQQDCEQDNLKKWLTKWNKYPHYDNNGFISTDGMALVNRK